jgi:WD40 repeat protein
MERRIRDWFGKHLISADGVRRPILVSDAVGYGLSGTCLHLLEQAFLIRGENRGSTPWYELAHDRLVGPIQNSNATWKAKLPAFQRAADLWKESGKKRDLLATGAVLHEGEWLEAERPAEFTLWDKEYLKDSWSARRQERIKTASIVLVLLFAFAVALAFMYFFRDRARMFETESRKQEELKIAFQSLQQAQEGLTDRPAASIQPAAQAVRLFRERKLSQPAWQAEAVLRMALANRGMKRLGRHGAPVQDMVLGRQDKWLVTRAADNSMTFYDLAEEGPPNSQSLAGSAGTALRIVGAADGVSFFTGHKDGRIYHWTIKRVRPQTTTLYKGGKSPVTALAVSPSAEVPYVVAGFADGRVVLLDDKSGKIVGDRLAQASSGAVREVALSPPPVRLLSVAANGMVQSWAADATARTRAQKAALDANVNGVKISPDARWLAGGTGDGVIRFYRIEPGSGKVLPVDPLQVDPMGRLAISATALGFSPDSSRLLAATSGLDARLYRSGNGGRFALELLPGKLPTWITAGAFSADGQRAIAGLADGSAFLWRIHDHNATLDMVLRVPGSELIAVKIGNEGRWVFTGGSDGTVRSWDLRQCSGEDAEPRWLPEPTGAPSIPGTVTLADNGTWLAARKEVAPDARDGNSNYSIVFSDLAQPGQQTETLPVRGPVPDDAGDAFSPDSSQFACLRGEWDYQAKKSDYHILIYYVKQPRRAPRVINAPGFVWSMAFSTDNRRLAYVTRDRVVVIPLATDEGPDPVLDEKYARPGRTYCAAMSPDDRWLAVAGWPSEADVRVWDLHKNTEPADLRGEWGTVRAMAFTPDNSTLATGSYGGAVLLWRRLDNTWEPILLPGYREGVVRWLAVEPQGSILRSRTRYGVTLWTLDTDALLNRADQVGKRLAR